MIQEGETRPVSPGTLQEITEDRTRRKSLVASLTPRPSRRSGSRKKERNYINIKIYISGLGGWVFPEIFRHFPDVNLSPYLYIAQLFLQKYIYTIQTSGGVEFIRVEMTFGVCVDCDFIPINLNFFKVLRYIKFMVIILCVFRKILYF
ncbi:UNVERIFIED_CONTAM: hypothetical protein PYX00_005536 [Menopon gallinae]|uniref:Uncharacterized protein n=1 Tax=Menopon gallinae TaxID=328185 RepID=A0AAW2HRU3_9NEOP